MLLDCCEHRHSSDLRKTPPAAGTGRGASPFGEAAPLRTTPWYVVTASLRHPYSSRRGADDGCDFQNLGPHEQLKLSSISLRFGSAALNCGASPRIDLCEPRHRLQTRHLQ